MSKKAFLRDWLFCLTASCVLFGCQSAPSDSSVNPNPEGSAQEALPVVATAVTSTPAKQIKKTFNSTFDTNIDEDVFMTLDQATYLEVLPPYSTQETLDPTDLLSLQPLWPTTGRITSLFGKRTLMRKTRMHTGMDIAGPRGTKVHAVAEGQIVFAGRKKGYGNTVIIAHDAVHQTLYAHLDKISVREGQFVQQSQNIGFMGRTGRSTGSHLHFEVRVSGIARNPINFLPKGTTGKIIVGQQVPSLSEQRAYYSQRVLTNR